MTTTGTPSGSSGSSSSSSSGSNTSSSNTGTSSGGNGSGGGGGGGGGSKGGSSKVQSASKPKQKQATVNRRAGNNTNLNAGNLMPTSGVQHRHLASNGQMTTTSTGGYSSTGSNTTLYIIGGIAVIAVLYFMFRQ